MNLKSSDIKQLLDEIVEEEKEKHGLTFDFHYIGRIKYIKNIETIQKQKLTLTEKIKETASSMFIRGFISENTDLVVIFDSKKRITLYKLVELIYAIYHEIGHAINEKKENIEINNYNNLIYFIDKFLLTSNINYYINTKYHDSLAHEIMADIYSLKKIKEFFNKNKQYKIDQELLEDIELIVKKRYQEYNLSKKIDKIIENNNFIYNNQDIRKLEPFCIFLNEKGEIRRIDDLLKNEKFNKIDQRIIEGFLKSKSFQKKILYDDISKEAQDYLEKIYNKENKKIK